MKSNVVTLSNSLSCAVEALGEVERASQQASLNREQTNLMRLLTEETISMTMDILKNCTGKFWMEWEGGDCQLHLSAAAPVEPAAKSAFAELSKSGSNAPRGLKNRIGALIAGILSRMEDADYYAPMMPGFIHDAGLGTAQVWSFAAYQNSLPAAEREVELEGVEKSILTAMADDIVVSVNPGGVELTVKKRFAQPAQAAMPRFTGLSHICIFVDEMKTAIDYYRTLLGVVPDHYLPHWKNPGFFRAAGFLDEAEKGDVSIAFVNVPGTKLTLELMQYHYPEGRKQPVFFAANDVSGARHVALKVTNIEEAFAHVKSMPDTRLINQSDQYRVFQISKTQPSQVRFFDQDVRHSDERNAETARILSQVKYFYFIDKYGLQWEFEQGHSDIGD